MRISQKNDFECYCDYETYPTLRIMGKWYIRFYIKNLKTKDPSWFSILHPTYE